MTSIDVEHAAAPRRAADVAQSRFIGRRAPCSLLPLIEKQLQPYSQEAKEGMQAAVDAMEGLVMEKMRVAT